MEKIIYDICPACKKKNTCYKVKGQKGYRVYCDKLNKMNLEIASEVNKRMSEKIFGKR